MIKEDLLLELGTEELPPKALRKLAQALCDNFKSSLDSSAIEYENIKWYATPRRLALKVTNISDTQPDKTIVKKGPSVSVAFNADNNPTKVGLPMPDRRSLLRHIFGDFSSEKPGYTEI